MFIKHTHLRWPVVQMFLSNFFSIVVKFCLVLKVKVLYFDWLLQYLRVAYTNYYFQFSSERLIAGKIPEIYEN